MATIYIKRGSSLAGGAANCKVYLSHTFVGELKNGEALEIPVEVGTHELSFYPYFGGLEWGKCRKFNAVVNEADEVVVLYVELEFPQGFKVEYADGKYRTPAASTQNARPSGGLYRTAQEQQQESTVRTAKDTTTTKQTNQFIDPDETVIATLGTNYAQNMLSGGGVAQGSAVLTEKRLYYKGDLFLGAGKIRGEHIVHIRDISMTSFVQRENIWFMLFGFLFVAIGIALLSKKFLGFSCILIGIIFATAGFLGKSTILEVSFPGGRFRFEVKWSSISSMQNFQRQIHLQKDRYYETEKQ